LPGCIFAHFNPFVTNSGALRGTENIISSPLAVY
jgi:hypothetical protein